MFLVQKWLVFEVFFRQHRPENVCDYILERKNAF